MLCIVFYKKWLEENMVWFGILLFFAGIILEECSIILIILGIILFLAGLKEIINKESSNEKEYEKSEEDQDNNNSVKTITILEFINFVYDDSLKKTEVLFKKIKESELIYKINLDSDTFSEISIIFHYIIYKMVLEKNIPQKKLLLLL